MKTLYFEGVGCVPLGDVENCRIRTAFYNDEGRVIYLELSGIERNKHTSIHLPTCNFIGFVDFCHYVTESLDDCNNNRVISVPEGLCVERKYYAYSKRGILNFVNKTLCCSFDEIRILDMFDGYRVHADMKEPAKTGYDYLNIMDNFNYNETLSNTVRDNFNRINEEMSQRFNSQYSVISYIKHDDKSITVRCNASDEAMRKVSLGRKRDFCINFNESV